MGDADRTGASSPAWSQAGVSSFVIKNTFLHCTVEEDNDNCQRMMTSRFCRNLRPKSEPPTNRNSHSHNEVAGLPSADVGADRWADQEQEITLGDDSFQPQVTAPAALPCGASPPMPRWQSTKDRCTSVSEEGAAQASVPAAWIAPGAAMTKWQSWKDDREPAAKGGAAKQGSHAEEAAAGSRRGSRYAEQRRISQDPMPWNAGVVTVMIRQIPRRYSQQNFLDKVFEYGFEGLVTFVYLPVAMKKFVNVGYGFVSFTEPCHALRFRDMFDSGFLDREPQSDDKPLKIHPATVQGYQAACLYFSWKPKDMRCGPIFLGPDGTGVVDLPIEKAPQGELQDIPAPFSQRRRSTNDDQTGGVGKQRQAWGMEPAARAKGLQPPGSWMSSPAATRGSASQQQPAHERAQRGEHGQQNGHTGAVFLGLNQPRLSAGRRGEQQGSDVSAKAEASHGRGGRGHRGERRGSASTQREVPQKWQQPAWGSQAHLQPGSYDKVDTWNAQQTGSRALGA